jgi:transcriptional regulator with XRE-family HTH domain
LAKDSLDLSAAEAALIEIRLSLAASLRERRSARHFSQARLARQLGSSRSRVAKMEAADPTVTIDLLMRALLALGASRRVLARIVARRAA